MWTVSCVCAGLVWVALVRVDTLRAGRDERPRTRSLRIFSDKAGLGVVKRHDGGPQVTVRLDPAL